jgi:hypothetical protein
MGHKYTTDFVLSKLPSTEQGEKQNPHYNKKIILDLRFWLLFGIYILYSSSHFKWAFMNIISLKNFSIMQNDSVVLL